MFELLSPRSQRAGLLAVSCGLSLHLQGDNVMLIRAKNFCLFPPCMADQNLNHIELPASLPTRHSVTLTGPGLYIKRYLAAPHSLQRFIKGAGTNSSEHEPT